MSFGVIRPSSSTTEPIATLLADSKLTVSTRLPHLGKQSLTYTPVSPITELFFGYVLHLAQPIGPAKMWNQVSTTTSNISGKIKVKHPKDTKTKNCLVRYFLLSSQILVKSAAMGQNLPNFDCLGARHGWVIHRLSSQFSLQPICQNKIA